MTLEKKKA